MRDYYADDLLLILPSSGGAGVRLCGEVYAAHRTPLALAVSTARQSAPTHEITVDLTGVAYLANSALETLVALACQLALPQRLVVRADPELRLGERIAAGGWSQTVTLRVIDVSKSGPGGDAPVES
ncbi:hypothetical protein AB0I66_00375 [Streptomyces sp. NPDC050439]|uniref:hypothetical protein n=1 Tax=unclassified Streptomyces TaxID=2593676 RepID=UPI00342FF8B7